MFRKYDYENFLASLLIKQSDLRRTALALRAFNVELSQVRDLTKSDSTAQIRFQFWLDIIDDIYKSKDQFEGTPDQRYQHFPVAAELQNVKTASYIN